MANSRLKLTCKNCGAQFQIGKNFGGAYYVPSWYNPEEFVKALNEFYEEHAFGSCAPDLEETPENDAKNYFVILEDGDELIPEVLQKYGVTLRGKCLERHIAYLKRIEESKAKLKEERK